MVKGLNGWDISQKARYCNFGLRSLTGAKVESMNDHVKPALRENTDHFIIYIWTNDVTYDAKSPNVVAVSITKLAIQLKSDSHDVTISNIITKKR